MSAPSCASAWSTTLSAASTASPSSKALVTSSASSAMTKPSISQQDSPSACLPGSRSASAKTQRLTRGQPRTVLRNRREFIGQQDRLMFQIVHKAVDQPLSVCGLLPCRHIARAVPLRLSASVLWCEHVIVPSVIKAEVASNLIRDDDHAQLNQVALHQRREPRSYS